MYIEKHNDNSYFDYKNDDFDKHHHKDKHCKYNHKHHYCKHHHDEYDHHCDHHEHKHHHCKCNDCVEDTLRAILKAQREVKSHHTCETACQLAINDLQGNNRKPQKDTIPFLLYCNCNVFKGSGVKKYYHDSKHQLMCIESYIFKIIDIKDDCAILELLIFKSDFDDDEYLSSPCCQIDHQCLEDLIGTGICIKVDLSHFTSISCLPAVKLNNH